MEAKFKGDTWEKFIFYDVIGQKMKYACISRVTYSIKILTVITIVLGETWGTFKSGEKFFCRIYRNWLQKMVLKPCKITRFTIFVKSEWRVNTKFWTFRGRVAITIEQVQTKGMGSKFLSICDNVIVECPCPPKNELLPLFLWQRHIPYYKRWIAPNRVVK